MRFKFLVSSLCFLFAVAANAQSVNYQEGKHYTAIKPSIISKAAPGKIEVIEFFWYGCPHCYRLQEPWTKWLKLHEAEIEYKPQPAILGKSWEVMGKAHHAMILAGAFDEKLHADFFSAIHVNKLKIQTLEGDEPKALFEWVSGIKGSDYAKKFKSEYMGVTMGAKIAKDRELQKAYKIEGTPTIVVAGKYSVNPSQAGNELAMVPIVTYLLKKALSEKAAESTK
jgi:thiol:disulfide interchange protein DsbA